MSEIHGVLGISKAMVFAYRSGKNPITKKVWLKLEMAEKNAGIAPPAPPGIAERETFVKEAAGLDPEKTMLRDDPQVLGYIQKASLEERVARLEKALQEIAEIIRTI